MHAGLGAPPQPPGRGAQEGAAGQPERDPSAVVDVNAVAPLVRARLTKRSFLNELEKRTDTVIIARGLHVAAGAPTNGQRPIHLYITAAPTVKFADRQKGVDAAVRAVSELLGPEDLGGQALAPAPRPPPPPAAPATPTPQVTRGADSVLVHALPTTLGPADAAAWLRGPGGAHVDYIGAACAGVSASVRGKGSGVEEDKELHVRVDWVCGEARSKQRVLDAAADLAADLVRCMAGAPRGIPPHPE